MLGDMGWGPWWPLDRPQKLGVELRVERGFLEEQDWGKSEPACHLRASLDTHSEVAPVRSPGWGGA